MGEASQRKRRMHARLQAQPWCIYCGGVNEATTTDHMPPITIFDQRRRPRGLEFSACQPCNSGGRVAEKIVGLVSRTYPDPPNDTGREELKRLYREFASYHPDLLEEMWPTNEQLQQEANLPAGTHVFKRTRTTPERSNEQVRCEARPSPAFQDDRRYRFHCRSRRWPLVLQSSSLHWGYTGRIAEGGPRCCRHARSR